MTSTIIDAPGTSRVAVLGVSSAVVSSLSNLLLLLLVARNANSELLGACAVVLTLYSLMLVLQRAALGDPLLAEAASLHDRDMRNRSELADHVCQSSLFVACLGVLPLLAGAMAVGGQSRTLFVITAGALGVLMLQDAWRSLAFAEGDPGRALLLDAVWLVVFLCLVPLLKGAGTVDAVSLMVVWVIGAALSTALGAILAGPSAAALRPSMAWFRQRSEIVRRYLGIGIIGGIAGFASLLLVPFTAGLAAVGVIRATLLVFGPLGQMYSGLLPVVVHRMMMYREIGRSRRRLFQGFIVSYCGAAVLLTLILQSGWLSIGQRAVGSHWADIRPLLFPALLMFVGFGVVAPIFFLLRSAGRPEVELKIRWWTLPATGLAPPLIAWKTGTSGFFWANAVAAWLMVAVAIVAMQRVHDREGYVGVFED